MRSKIIHHPVRAMLGRHLARAICLVIAGATLAGCIVEPYPAYRPYPRHYYYR